MVTHYWLGSCSKQNFDIDRHRGFDIDGYSGRRKRWVQQVRRGDKVVEYVSKHGFAAIRIVVSEPFHDERIIWPPKNGEVWPWRFMTQPELVLSEGRFIPFASLKSKLSIQPLALRSFGEITEEDFSAIESEMRKAK